MYVVWRRSESCAAIWRCQAVSVPKFTLPRFYIRTITDLMFEQYSETVIKKIIKNKGEV